MVTTGAQHRVAAGPQSRPCGDTAPRWDRGHAGRRHGRSHGRSSRLPERKGRRGVTPCGRNPPCRLAVSSGRDAEGLMAAHGQLWARRLCERSSGTRGCTTGTLLPGNTDSALGTQRELDSLIEWQSSAGDGTAGGRELPTCPQEACRDAAQQRKGGEQLRDAAQGELILLIKAASSQGLDNLSCCRLFTAVEFNTPMNKAPRSRGSELLTLLHSSRLGFGILMPQPH